MTKIFISVTTENGELLDKKEVEIKYPVCTISARLNNIGVVDQKSDVDLDVGRLEPTPTLGSLNLTELEQDCLRACYVSEYNGAHGTDEKPAIWAFSVADNAQRTTKAQVSGVISSLVKKGIVSCDGKGNEAAIGVISDAAHEFAKQMGWNE